MNEWLKDTSFAEQWEKHRNSPTFKRHIEQFREAGNNEETIKWLIEGYQIVFEWGFAEGYLDRDSEDNTEWWKE